MSATPINRLHRAIWAILLRRSPKLSVETCKDAWDILALIDQRDERGRFVQRKLKRTP